MCWQLFDGICEVGFIAMGRDCFSPEVPRDLQYLCDNDIIYANTYFDFDEGYVWPIWETVQADDFPVDIFFYRNKEGVPQTLYFNVWFRTTIGMLTYLSLMIGLILGKVKQMANLQ